MDPFDRPLIPTPAKLLKDLSEYLLAIWDGWDDTKQKWEFCQKAPVQIAMIRDVLSQAEKFPFDNPEGNR